MHLRIGASDQDVRAVLGVDVQDLQPVLGNVVVRKWERRRIAGSFEGLEPPPGRLRESG
ncbi:MAG TPA: hypothetical protein VI076_16625 [Actinopolymorphaceae bacterium]